VAESLTFDLVPDTDLIIFELLEKSIAQIRRIVADVDYAVTREKVGRQWVVRDIHSSETQITIHPLLDTQGVVDVIAQGLRIVTSDDSYEPPPFFPIDTLDRLRKTKGLFQGRRERLRRIHCRADTTPVAIIDSSIGTKVDRILSKSYNVLGSLEGQLDAISVHGSRRFTIWDRVTGAPIRCRFPHEELDRILSLLGRRVLVAGRVRYYRNGTPQSISEITEIRDRSPSENAPDVIFGSVPSDYITSGKDSVDYIRTLRD